jgi:hypothetical protein
MGFASLNPSYALTAASARAAWAAAVRKETRTPRELHGRHCAFAVAGASRRGPGDMVAFAEPKRRLPALIPVAVVLLATNAAFGYGYLHYRGISADQETAITRVESANADLQDALNRMRDQTQRSAQQLSLDNRELQTRLAALERRLGRLEPISAKPPSPTERPEPPPAPLAATGPPSASAIQGALKGQSGPANFTAPGWVPDYFSNESGAITGTPRRQQRRSHHRESSVRNPWCRTYGIG